MAGRRLLFLTTLALQLLGDAAGSQPGLRSRAAAAACRLDNNESESWGALLATERLDTWVCSLLGSLLVGLSGVFPLLIIPLEMGTLLRSEGGCPAPDVHGCHCSPWTPGAGRTGSSALPSLWLLVVTSHHHAVGGLEIHVPGSLGLKCHLPLTSPVASDKFLYLVLSPILKEGANRDWYVSRGYPWEDY